MSVKIRPYGKGDAWEADVRIRWPDGTVQRERVKVPVTGKSAALRWAEDRERHLVKQGPAPKRNARADLIAVPTLKEFAPRFMEGYARANQEKPSSIAGKETILRVHLIPRIGDRPLDLFTTEEVQRVKVALIAKAPMTPSKLNDASLRRSL